MLCMHCAFYLVRSRITQGRLVGLVGGGACTFYHNQLLLKQITRYVGRYPLERALPAPIPGPIIQRQQCEREVGAEDCKTNDLDESFLI